MICDHYFPHPIGGPLSNMLDECTRNGVELWLAIIIVKGSIKKMLATIKKKGSNEIGT
jgi:hypothetical protein